jgi:uncharacterized protein with HEPN domain
MTLKFSYLMKTDYNRIDNQLVWHTAHRKLPELIEEVKILLPE